MKALILAGGLGTRLRPLTYTRPKHLLPIAGRPHIEHVLDLLGSHGIHDVVLTTSYLAEAFTETVRSAAVRGINVEVAHEEEPMGTAGAIKNAADFVSGETFLAFNGDVLTDVDLDAFISFHEESGAAASILLTPVADPSAYGVVPTDAKGRVERFIEKPAPADITTNMINAGVYVLEPEVLARIPARRVCSIERETFPALVEEGRVYAWGTGSYWMDIGTPDKYLSANLDAVRGRFRTTVQGEVVGDVLMGEGALVAEGARVSSACVGPGCVIEDGAVVSECVLLPWARVASEAEIAGCILGERARVTAGTKRTGVAIADGATEGD